MIDECHSVKMSHDNLLSNWLFISGIIFKLRMSIKLATLCQVTITYSGWEARMSKMRVNGSG